MVHEVSCPPIIFPTGSGVCDYTFSVRWCTLGDRDGYRAWYPGLPAGPPAPPITILILTLDTVRHSPEDITEPDPTSTWSCTVASLGRGPVKWTLQYPPSRDWFTPTDWFGYIGHMTGYMGTMSTFDLNSTVFNGLPPIAGIQDGIIRNVGVTGEEDGPYLTPGMRQFDPSRAYQNPKLDDWWNPSWKFYNELGWDVRFDISTGYMELNHSWYRDDKNLNTPIIFNGTWNGYIPLDCQWDFSG